MYTIKELEESMPQTGTVEWIGVRTQRKGLVKELTEVEAVEDQGLIEDHYSGKPGSKRQVTLIQSEHLPVVATIMKIKAINPALLRRNIVVSGINLLSLRNRRFKVGDVALEGTGDCARCSRMEENLGPGGWNSMRGHGGITTRVVKGGKIRQGDRVSL